MDEAKREELALFRYGMILPFLSQDKLEWGLKGELRRRLAQEHVDIPHSTKHRLCEDTLRKWLAAYQAKGFDGLKPQPRSDQGHTRTIAPEAFEKAIALKPALPQARERSAATRRRQDCSHHGDQRFEQAGRHQAQHALATFQRTRL